jgi:hypothetical protein
MLGTPLDAGVQTLGETANKTANKTTSTLVLQTCEPSRHPAGKRHVLAKTLRTRNGLRIMPAVPEAMVNIARQIAGIRRAAAPPNLLPMVFTPSHFWFHHAVSPRVKPGH